MADITFWQALSSVVIVLVFILINAFFVIAEFSIVKVRQTQIEPLAQKGNRRAKLARSILENTNAYLSAAQLGVTMTSLALGWIGEPLVANIFGPLFIWFGIHSQELVHGISLAVAFSVITAVEIVVGELAPKVLAIHKAAPLLLAVAYPFRAFYIIFRPLILLLNSASNRLLSFIGINSSLNGENDHSEEELRMILVHEHQVSVSTRNIALNAIDFHQKQARHAMTPRKEIVALSANAPVQKNIELMRTHKYSRYPVFMETIDNIVGVIHTKDIFKTERQLQKDFTLQRVMRDAFFLPETATLEKVLETILQKRNHMILLADEYGGTAGLITLENVLEELVGNIQDEYDREAPEIVKVNEHEFLVDGALTTSDVERMFEIELSPMDIRSIGGFFIEQLGHVPKAGETLCVDGLELTAEKIIENAIELVRIKKLPPPTDEESERQEEE
ncbi:MAG TPA: hemolysin family protein [Bacteroidota bacterium]|nr:hemolysin family protein [Bacteroidota bacterium]